MGLSRGDRLLLIAVLAAAAMADSGYLTFQYYEAASSSWCDLSSFFNCTLVRQSPYAAIGGVLPTATIALAGFLVILLLVVLAFRGRERLGPWSVDRWILVLAVLGGLAGLGLTFVEIFIIQAVCILCVIGFALDLGILGIAWTLDRGGADAESPSEA